MLLRIPPHRRTLHMTRRFTRRERGTAEEGERRRATMSKHVEKLKGRLGLKTKDQLELQLDEALSKKRYFTKASLLTTLAEQAMQGHQYQRVMDAAWNAMVAKPKYHHRVMKGLLLIDALIKTGPERTIEDVRDRIGRIKVLMSFSFRNADGLDVGAPIRQKVSLFYLPLHFVVRILLTI